MTKHGSLFPAILKRSTKWKPRNLIDSQVLTVNSWGTKRESEQSRVTQLGGKTCGGIEARTLMDVESERGVRFPELLKCPKAFFKNNYLSSAGQVLNTQTRLQFLFCKGLHNHQYCHSASNVALEPRNVFGEFHCVVSS